jgi:hypothetical protein
MVVGAPLCVSPAAGVGVGFGPLAAAAALLVEVALTALVEVALATLTEVLAVLLAALLLAAVLLVVLVAPQAASSAAPTGQATARVSRSRRVGLDTIVIVQLLFIA